MSLLYYLNEDVIREAVSPEEVLDALKNKIDVIINYSDEDDSHPGKRLIEPYVYGLSKAGNPVIRAYQFNGDTKRGVPKWKLFRLDRITSWTPTQQHFNVEPQAAGWAAEAYNKNGDNLMSAVYDAVTVEEPLTDYEKLKAQVARLKNSKPININQLKDGQKYTTNDNQPQVNPQGPIDSTNQIQSTTPSTPAEKAAAQQSMSQSDFQAMLQRNLAITDKEKQKRGFSLQQNTNNQEEPQKAPESPVKMEPQQNGPIVDNQPQQNNDEVDNKNGEQTEQQPQQTVNASPMTQDDFKKMLQRNLAITDKEKQKRGFSLSNK